MLLAILLAPAVGVGAGAGSDSGTAQPLVGPMDKLQLESAASRDVRRLKMLLPGAHPRTAWPE